MKPSAALAALLLLPAAARAQSFHSIEFSKTVAINQLLQSVSVPEGMGVGFKVALEDWKDIPRPQPIGPAIAPTGLAHYVRFEQSVDWAFYVEAGKEAELEKLCKGKCVLSVDAQILWGKGSSYYIQMPEKAFKELARKHEVVASDTHAMMNALIGRMKEPISPFRPETLPVNGTVLLKDTDFAGTGLEATFKQVGVELEYTRRWGKAIGLSKNSATQVQAMIGPYKAVYSNFFTGLGIDADVASIWFGGGERVDKESYKLKTVVFDIGSKEGLAAFHYFMSTGRMNEIRNWRGVIHYGEIHETNELDQSYFGFEASLGPIKVKAASVNDSFEISKRTVDYNNGYHRFDRELRYDQDIVIHRIIDSPGRPKYDQYMVLMPHIPKGVALLYAQLFQQVQWLPDEGPVRHHRPSHLHKWYDMEIDLTPKELSALKPRSIACFHNKACVNQIEAYDNPPGYTGRVDKNGYVEPPPGIAIPTGLPYTYYDRTTKIEVLRFLSGEGHSSLQKVVKRETIPFLFIEPFFMETSLRCLRPGAAHNRGKPIAHKVIFVAMDN